MFNAEFKSHISKLMQHLTEDTERNNAIIKDVSHCIQNGQIPLILTERRKHAKNLRNKLNDLGYKTSILQGGMSHTKNIKEKQNLDDAHVVIATGKYIGEGFDLPRLDTLFLAFPISWKGTLVQYVGRIHTYLKLFCRSK